MADQTPLRPHLDLPPGTGMQPATHRKFYATLSVVALTALIFTAVFVGQAQADITLPKIFSDHMVLQRNSTVPVWGTATPGERLMVTFDGQQQAATATPAGVWSTSIKTGDAGGPYELQIAATESDLKVGFTNVMVGDVWICAGQSNMEWPVSAALNPETEIEKAKNFPNLRLFSIETSNSPKPLEDFSRASPWAICSPDSVKEFSAVGYFFGCGISKKLKDLPIGLIDSSWGGTRCEAWVSRESLDEVAALKPMLEHWDGQTDTATSQNHPANIYNSMIAPMTRFPVRGFIWYQGEANVGRGAQYATLFPTLIQDWRKQFGSQKLPFYFAQLAPYNYEGGSENALPELWDAQLKTALKVPHVGMVVTADVGNLEDIHPRNKQAVGQRFSQLALKNDYADDLKDSPLEGESCGPLFESISISGSQLRVTFRHAGKKLSPRGQGTELIGFTVCGDDGVFHPANATVVDDVVVELICAKVPEPTDVRYGWGEGFEMNLVNDAGLPAAPFRSDDLPLESAGRNF